MKKNVDAVVLAGGKGTRLAPLTEDTPKPLLKVMGKTVLENVLDRIADAGIRNAYVTTMYLPWQIESIGSKYRDVNISYIREKQPLGTAGAAAGAYDADADAVIVLSGDGLYDFDLRKAIDFHFEKNADVTIVTYSSSNPLEYGVVLYDDDGKITRFEEKPPWAKVISGSVNTGIYVINRDILKNIPHGIEYDFAKQLFPLLLAKGRSLFAYEAKGVWHDIGNLDGYFEANKSALEGKLRNLVNDGFTQKELKERGIESEMPFYVSKKAIIGTNVKIGAYSVIGDKAVISDNCDISSSIICDGVSLGIGCGIYGSIIGRNTKLGENCISSEGCVIGANASCDDSIILPKYSFIHSGERISSGEYRERPCGKREKSIFTDEGICCDVSEKSPEYILRIGYAAATVLKEKKSDGSVRVGIMTDDNSVSARIGRIILEGVRSCGVRSMDFGCGYRAMARFAATEFITDAVIYVSRNKDGHINARIYDPYGLPVSDIFERDLTNAFFSHSEYTAPESFYETDRLTDIGTLYYSGLIKKARQYLPDGSLSGFVCTFGNIGNIRAYSPTYTAICAITELGGQVTSKAENTNFCFEIDETGLESSFISGHRILDSFHMNAALLANMTASSGKDELFFACTMPESYKSIAKNNGYRIREYEYCSEKSFNTTEAESVKKMYFLEDGVFRTIYFAILLHNAKNDLHAVSKSIPSFEVYTKNYTGNKDRAYIMQRLGRLSQNQNTVSAKPTDDGQPEKSKTPGEGIQIRFSNGRITVIPGKTSGFKIISESVSMEAAKELCDKAEEYLN